MKKKFQIGKILTEIGEVTVDASTDAKDLNAAVSKIVDDVAQGAIGDLIKTVVQTGIKALIADAKGSVSEKFLYTIRLNGLALERIDIYLYRYELQSKGLITMGHNCFVYGYAISTIGEEITRAALTDLVANNMSDPSKMTELELIKKQQDILTVLLTALDLKK